MTQQNARQMMIAVLVTIAAAYSYCAVWLATTSFRLGVCCGAQPVRDFLFTPLFMLAWVSPVLFAVGIGLGIYVPRIVEAHSERYSAIRHSAILGAVVGGALGVLPGFASGYFLDTVVASVLGAIITASCVAWSTRGAKTAAV